MSDYYLVKTLETGSYYSIMLFSELVNTLKGTEEEKGRGIGQ